MPTVSHCMQRIRESIPKESLWVVADQSVLRAVRLNMDVYRGLRGVILRRALRLFRWQWLQLAVVLVVGSAMAVRFLLQQLATPALRRGLPTTNVDSNDFILFVGFGARAEEKLFCEFCEHVRGDTIRINQVEIATMARLQHVGIFTMFREVFSAFRNVRTAIRKLPHDFDKYRLEWMVFAAMRLAIYAYGKAWFLDFRKSTPLLNAYFLSPDTTAFAAIDAGIPCHFIQHGLLSKGVMVPAFQRIAAITIYEAEYLRKLLATTEVAQILRQRPSINISDRNAVVIASGNRSPDDMNLSIPFIIEATSLGLTMYVRPFVGEDVTVFWESQRHVHKVPFSFLTSDGSFNDLVDRVKPLFVVSWGSTALVDALYMGVIPICIANLDDHYVDDTVYPILECCLHWPRDQDLIRQACRSQEKYDSVLEGLRAKESSLKNR